MNAWKSHKVLKVLGEWVCYDAEKRTVPGSSNLNLSFSGAQQKFFAREMKEKGVRFCFLKLKGKISPKSSRAG